MKNIFKQACIIFLLLSSLQGFAQTTGNDFATKQSYFDRVLKPWKYSFKLLDSDTTHNTPVAKITFERSEAIRVKKDRIKPAMSFDIYRIEDSSFCLEKAKMIKLTSSCTTPNIGGDIIMVGHYIFLNSSVCVNCGLTSGVDFCRSNIAALLSYLSKDRNDDVTLWIKNLPIERIRFTY